VGNVFAKTRQLTAEVKNVTKLMTGSLYKKLCCEMRLCESVPRRTMACIYSILCYKFSPICEVGNE
jgi:hypothetical protein